MTYSEVMAKKGPSITNSKGKEIVTNKGGESLTNEATGIDG